MDFKQLCAGVVLSYHAAVEYRPDWLYWKALVVGEVGVGMFVASLGLFCCALSLIIDTKLVSNPLLVLILFMFIFVVACVVVFLSFVMLFVMSSLAKDDSENLTKMGYMLMVFGNPIVLPFFLIFHAGKYLWGKRLAIGEELISIVSAALFVTKEIGCFFARAFRYVHSERRTLCFVDAFLGAIAGFFLGSAILGAGIGAVLGVINYEIVSIRWLKIVPAKAQ